MGLEGGCGCQKLWRGGRVVRRGGTEAFRAGQGEIIAKILNNRSLSDMKPTFRVRDSLLTHHVPALFSILGVMQNLTDIFIFTRNSTN